MKVILAYTYRDAEQAAELRQLGRNGWVFLDQPSRVCRELDPDDVVYVTNWWRHKEASAIHHAVGAAIDRRKGRVPR